MAVVHPAGDLAQPQFTLEQAHLLIGQHIGDGPSVHSGSVLPESFSWNAAVASLAVGQQIKIGLQDLQEEPRTETAAIKHDGEPTPAHQAAQFPQEARKHLDQTGIGFGGDHKQRIARGVIDPVIGGRRHRQAHARQVSFGQTVLAMISAHMAVDVEESHRLATPLNAVLGQGLAELGGAFEEGQPREFAPERFNFRSPIDSKHPAQICRRMFLQTLGPLNPPQCHQQQD